MKEKGDLVVGVRKRIISTLLTGMSLHRDEETMMRNGCLALCQFRIPQDVVSTFCFFFFLFCCIHVFFHLVLHVQTKLFINYI